MAAMTANGLFFIQLYRWCPSVLKAMMLIRPEKWGKVVKFADATLSGLAARRECKPRRTSRNHDQLATGRNACCLHWRGRNK
jgi:hypothetical protein